MNQLAEIKQPIDKLPEVYRPYILAQTGKTLREINHPDNLEAIYKCIVIAFEYLGHSTKNEDRKVNMFLAEEFYKLICNKYPHAKHNEIELAFKKLAIGDYAYAFPKDKFLGINVNTLWTAWKTYIESEELKQAKREWLAIMEAPVSDKPTHDIMAFMTKSVLDVYKEFLKDGTLPHFGHVYYEHILKVKGVKTVITNNEIKANIRAQAFKNYEASLRDKKFNRTHPKEFESLLKGAFKGNASYDTEARKLALKYYFEECKTQNKQPI